MKPWHELTSLPVQQVNKRAQGKTCGECDNFEPCLNPTCLCGICRAELDRWCAERDRRHTGNLDAFVCADYTADECEDYKEDE